MQKLFLFLVIASITLHSHAQLQGQPLIDSLTAQLPKAKEDSNKVKLLNDLSLTYYSISPDEGLKFGKQALALAERLNWKKGMAYACKVIAGNYGYGKSDYVQALDFSFKSLQLFTETQDKTGIAKILGDIGVVYWFQSDYPKALRYFFDALRIYEERGIQHEIAATLCNIGLVYNNQEDYRKALEYLLKANKIDEKLGNKVGVAANLGNIGELYMSLSETTKAVEYNVKSLRLYEEMGDKNGIARNLGNLGTIHKNKKEYSQALKHYLKALKICQELGNKSSVAIILGNIGSTYLEMVKDNSNPDQHLLPNKTAALQQAKEYISKAVAISGEIGDLNNLSGNYRRLSEVQVLMGNHKSALESFTSYTNLKDSIFNMEKDKKLVETAMRYEFDKKEAAARAAQEKKDILQRNIRNTFIAGAAVLLLILIGLINRYRYKQKANRELAAAYENLKATQQQLIESEKMAAFGAMATRMAHEIQNPLNFVNNFSDISRDLVQDILFSNDDEDKKATAELLIFNLDKINHHGNRAASIINRLQKHAGEGTTDKFLEEDKQFALLS